MARKYVNSARSDHTILVVDDSRLMLESTRMLLEAEGHRVLTAPDGESALRILQHERPQLILLDYFMPGMTGEEVVRRVRESDRLVQIVLVTGYSGEKPARAMMRALDIQGYHDKSEGAERLLLWVEVALKSYHHLVAEVSLREREERLQQSEKMEAVGRLAGGVAHDFNNLLTAIKGFGDLLHYDLPQDDPRQEYVSEIRRAADRAASLTHKLLAFSRKQVLQPQVMNLNASVTEMDQLLRRLIREDIEVATRLDPALRCVQADPGQIEQVLMNLVINAHDAMPHGGRLEIETANVELDASKTQGHEAPTPGPYAVLTVRDTGCGMDRETQARIFEPFFTTKEKGRGTGLGLATVYGIVTQSGGHITVCSEVGSGTTFKIYLPGVEEEVEHQQSIPISTLAPGTGTVLVAEDESAVRTLVRTILQRRGYTVLVGEDGADALHLLEQHEGRLDLVVTDVVMPRMNGRELADHVRALFPDMPVLFMSGYAEDAIVHHGVLEPGIHFVEKPFQPNVFLDAVHSVLMEASVAATCG